MLQLSILLLICKLVVIMSTNLPQRVMNCTEDLFIYDYKLFGCGLTHQTLMYRAMILVADVLGRDTFIGHVSPQLDLELGYLPFSRMFDVQATNALLSRNKNLTSRICTGANVRFDKIETVDVSVAGHIKPPDSLNNRFLRFAQNPVMIGLDSLFNPTTSMDLRFRFAPEFYEIAAAFKEQHLGHKYNAVHFRVEDDWLHHIAKSIPKNSQKGFFYSYLYHMVGFIQAHLDTSLPLFVAVGADLTVLPFALEYLQQFFPTVLMTPKRNVFSQYGLPEGRELYAIVDKILLEDAVDYVGSSVSTFSIDVVNSRSISGLNSFYFGFTDAHIAHSSARLHSYFDNFAANFTKGLPLEPPQVNLTLHVPWSTFMSKPRGWAKFPHDEIKAFIKATYNKTFSWNRNFQVR